MVRLNMGEYLNSLKEDFKKKAVYDVLKWLVVALVISAIGYLSLFTDSCNDLIENFRLSSFLAGLFVGILVLGLLLVLRKISKVRRPLRPSDPLSPDFPTIDANFEILDLRILYDHREIDSMVYTKRKKLKALKDNLDRYADRYNWTGKGAVSPRSLRKSEKYYETERRSTWQYYELRFEKSVKKGEEVDVDVVWDLKDTERKAIPFMSTTIEEPTKKLSLKVKFPNNSDVDHVIKEISPFIGAKMPFSSVREATTEKEYEWIIDDPKLLFHYELRWEW